MDPITTLLLARTCTVILDRDRVASASTRPARDEDVERFEDDLAQLGFVMSLDLAMTVRRLPQQTIEHLRSWMVATLAKALGARRPHVPLFDGYPTKTVYARRLLTWLLTRPAQPCPWCGQIQPVGALDPCGHLVCRPCWSGGEFSGCPICHRRVTPGSSFIVLPPDASAAPILRHDGGLRVIHLAFDVMEAARERFERLIARATPLSRDDRTELEAVIDALGPRVAIWLPARIPVRETMAIALARLWIVAPDRSAMVRATQGHLTSATDVLRVATVLMHGDPALAEPVRLRSIGRGLRRAVLEALDRMPPEQIVEDMRRHAELWKRAGERLHPFELARRLPTAALAFVSVRRTDVAHASFGAAIRAQAAALPNVRIADGRLHVTAWAGAVEDALRAGDARAAAERLAARPADLLRRADHLVRVAAARQPDALDHVLAAIRAAMPRGAPATVLGLAAHVTSRSSPWRRRIVFPRGDVMRAWAMPDGRAALPPDAIAAIADAARGELVARAEARSRFARAVIDRGLDDLLVPRRASRAWPRGTELAVAADRRLRLFLHREELPGARVDVTLSVALFDASWRHAGELAAVWSDDAASPRAATAHVDLELGALGSARHAVMVVSGALDRLALAFVGLVADPVEPFDPRAAVRRFELRGRSAIALPLTIDLEARRLRWLDVRVRRRALHAPGGYRAALAHLGRDFEDWIGSRARPTLWQLACIHASARANVVYVRGPGAIASFRRRDGEPTGARLARIVAGAHDGLVPAIPAADAPAWVALLHDDLALPRGSVGYVLEARGPGITRLDAVDLLAELAAR